MNAKIIGQLTLAVVSLVSSLSLQAGQGCTQRAAWQPELAVCHQLMMERDCIQYKNRLANLPKGAIRTRYLGALVDIMRDRELACGGTPTKAEVLIQTNRRPPLVQS